MLYRGKITRKYIEDGKYCVDIEHWGENQRGVKVTQGKATIILPSKAAVRQNIRQCAPSRMSSPENKY